jgi:hypothetical protein
MSTTHLVCTRLRLELVELGQPSLESRHHLRWLAHRANHAQRTVTEFVLGLTNTGGESMTGSAHYESRSLLLLRSSLHRQPCASRSKFTRRMTRTFPRVHSRAQSCPPVPCSTRFPLILSLCSPSLSLFSQFAFGRRLRIQVEIQQHNNARSLPLMYSLFSCLPFSLLFRSPFLGTWAF